MFGWLFGKRRRADAPKQAPLSHTHHPHLVEPSPTPLDPIEAPDIIHPPTTPEEPSGDGER